MIDSYRTVPAKAEKEPGVCHAIGNQLYFTCPGCSQWCSVGAEVISGSLDAVNTLTLRPTLHCSRYCGWRGKLMSGVFQSV